MKAGKPQEDSSVAFVSLRDMVHYHFCSMRNKAVRPKKKEVRPACWTGI